VAIEFLNEPWKSLTHSPAPVKQDAVGVIDWSGLWLPPIGETDQNENHKNCGDFFHFLPRSNGSSNAQSDGAMRSQHIRRVEPMMAVRRPDMQQPAGGQNKAP